MASSSAFARPISAVQMPFVVRIVASAVAESILLRSFERAAKFALIFILVYDEHFVRRNNKPAEGSASEKHRRFWRRSSKSSLFSRSIVASSTRVSVATDWAYCCAFCCWCASSTISPDGGGGEAFGSLFTTEEFGFGSSLINIPPSLTNIPPSPSLFPFPAAGEAEELIEPENGMANTRGWSISVRSWLFWCTES